MSDTFPFIGLESFARNLYNDDAKANGLSMIWVDLTGDDRRRYRKMVWSLCFEAFEQNKVGVFEGESRRVIRS